MICTWHVLNNHAYVNELALFFFFGVPTLYVNEVWKEKRPLA